MPDPISDDFSETGLIAAITYRERAGNLCRPLNKVSLNVRALDYVHVTMTKLSRFYSIRETQAVYQKRTTLLTEFAQNLERYS